MNQPTKEKDWSVRVLQGTVERTLPIKSPTKNGAWNQAERILKIQGVKPWKVLGATEKKP